MISGVAEGQECGRCAELENRFRDPATPNPGASLYVWATHHLNDHGTVPEPRPGCPECARYSANPGAVHARVWERWARAHFMSCRLAPDWKPGDT
ncbi:MULTISPECIES: hypothetical protein [unclassified Streptomyces]|uniref:hypothetical protein n=1 Tax=unclassified Streptomyces TaxID=2593676 RepID=UPI002E288E97|nr:hypothetical protein [Streptomyces sp. NBC_00223]